MSVYVCLYQGHSQKVCEESEYESYAYKQSDNDHVFLHVSVHSEEHQKTDAGTRKES